jgi:hypothetical protein
MAKAQAFGDKVKGKIRTDKKMVKFILPMKGKSGTGVRFKEGLLDVPAEKDHADYIAEKMSDLLR